MLSHSIKIVSYKAVRKIFSMLINFLSSNGRYRTIEEKILHDAALEMTGMRDAILSLIKHAEAKRQSVAAIYCEIADLLLGAGWASVAERYYEYSLELSCQPSTYSLYLQCLLMSPTVTEEKLSSSAYRYNELFLKSIKKYNHYSNELTLNKQLKVGYLCHFFHNSVSQSLLIPFLRAHNRQRIKVFCYSDTDSHEVPDHVRNVADVWRDTKFLTDEKLSSLIRKDQIDVLLELNGHCVINRYGVIARKPAPIQITYYNQCATSGIENIDYNLIGDEVILQGTKQHYAETIYFMKGVTGIAVFPDDFPACASVPYIKNHYITFGSFGGSHKVNAGVIKVWCDILKKVPNSRFYMKAGTLSHAVFQNAYKKIFESHGINMSRVRLEGYSEHRKMLECYSDVDIALDTFPYAAGTTTMEAIWQGVPVITLSGDTYSSQNGKSILLSINRPELIAYSQSEYINKAVELAADPERLIKYRQQLRDDFRRSDRANASAFASKLEDAYYDMWAQFCANAQAGTSKKRVSQLNQIPNNFLG